MCNNHAQTTIVDRSCTQVEELGVAAATALAALMFGGANMGGADGFSEDDRVLLADLPFAVGQKLLAPPRVL